MRLPVQKAGIPRTVGVFHVPLVLRFAQIQTLLEARSTLPPAFAGDNRLVNDPPPASDDALAALALEFEFYGQYCGPAYGDETGCAPADDEVDAACCRHDTCYGRLRGHDCRCEKAMLKDQAVAIAKEAAKGNLAAVAAGEAMIALFAIKPCKCGSIPFTGLPLWVPNPSFCPL